MPTRTSALIPLLLVLTACSAPEHDQGPPTSLDHEIRTMDESLSIRVPADWQRMDESLLPAAVVLAAQGSDERDLVIVRRFDDQRGAEDQAVWVAAGLSDRGVICERLDSSDVLGASNLVFDCPSPEGETARRLLVPVPTADGSVLFLVETSAGDSLEHAAAVAGPIVASLKTF